MHSKELLKGTLKTIILKLLAEQKKMYGYEITQHVSKLTDGKLVLTEGALYPSLHKLEAEGLLTTEKVKVGSRVRKYYSLTSKGTTTSQIKIAEFKEYMMTMRLVLGLKTT